MKKRVTCKQKSEEFLATSDQDHTLENVAQSPSRITLLVSFLILFRVLNALVIRTWFVPDEFWQGPEVAHNLVFGYGYKTWEWQQGLGLRGYTFPLLFVVAFKILHIFAKDSANALITTPHLLQASFAGFGDFFLFKLSVKLFGNASGKWTLLCNLLSWFTFYCITRTLTNSTETVLTTIALYYWPWEPCRPKESNMGVALMFAALACLIRPTAAIMWIPLTSYFFIHTNQKLSFLFTKVLPVGIVALMWSICLDSWFYGELTIVQLNFVVFNVVKDLGTFYGRHPWHWYFTQGFPAIAFTHLPLFCAGVYHSKGIQRLPAFLILWVITIYSCLGHKEFRFIFPILPLCMCYCGYYLSTLTPIHQYSRTTYNILKSIWCRRIIITVLCITNIPLALYTSTVHQKGAIEVMQYVQSEVQSKGEHISVMFLMPCHSTPYYSHVHSNITMRFLECPPNETPGYIDEADKFFLSPNEWLEKEFSSQHRELLPTHLILFDVLIQKIEKFLRDSSYKECTRLLHTHFPEGRIGKEVVVFCLE